MTKRKKNKSRGKLRKGSRKKRSKIKTVLRRSKSKEVKIIDVPLSKQINKGTKASHGEIDYHYQNYSNIMDYLKNIKAKDICLFENSSIHLDINDIKKGIFILYDIKIFIKNIKMCLKSGNILVPVILNLITGEGNHANILLINKKDKTIELYEPHGARTSTSEMDGVVGIYRK